MKVYSFLYVCYLFGCLLLWSTYTSTLPPFFNWVVCPFLIDLWEFFIYPGYEQFLYFFMLHFPNLYSILWWTEAFNINVSSFPVFSFMITVFCIPFKKYFPTLKSYRCYPIYLLEFLCFCHSHQIYNPSGTDFCMWWDTGVKLYLFHIDI